ERRGPAPADEEERSGTEERCGQQPAELVVRAERSCVPAVRRAPGEGRRGELIGAERGGPGDELGTPRLAEARDEPPGEPERDERRREGEERFHAEERSSVAVREADPARRRGGARDRGGR